MKIAIGIIAAIVILAGSIIVFKGKAEAPAGVPGATIYRTDEGFSPSQVTIRRGQSVVFINSSKGETWPASDSHPLHDVYPEFDPKHPIKPGETWVFVFDKEGEWIFHDHLRSNRTGVVRVTQ